MSNDDLVNVVGRFLFANLDHRALSDGADHFDLHSILGLEKGKKKTKLLVKNLDSIQRIVQRNASAQKRRGNVKGARKPQKSI